ncbi:MAG: hypothetical protein K2G90_08310 [Muribaculaceae bacterium]|nr:hypothetical protein [Muribaculaceae bacterium]MDE6009194.1 hypothetical protein [Muribaculaceae bacterium]
MKKNHIAALILLLLLWLWLCRAIIVGAGGFTFKNIFLICASGIIIFVPLWKKYVRGDKKKHID